MKSTIAVLLLLATPTFGADLARPVRDVTPIFNQRGAARILFKLDSPIEASNVAIRSAILRIPLAGAVEDRRLEVRLHPVTKAWTPGAVDWNSGWSRPGGDFEDDFYAKRRLDLSKGSSDLILDCTVLLKELVEHGYSADGFVLTVDPSEGEGIRIGDLARLEALSTASLDVKYRTIPPPPDQRGRR